jgi:hypothetical protein
MTWRQLIDELKLLIAEAKFSGYFGDTDIAQAIYNALQMVIIWCPQPALQDFNIKTCKWNHSSSVTYALDADVLQILLLTVDGKPAFPRDINDFQFRSWRYPNDISDPYYAKFGSELSVFPIAPTTSAVKDGIVAKTIKKPVKWETVANDAKIIEIPYSCEAALRQGALYYIKLKDTKGEGQAAIIYWNNFWSSMSAVWSKYGMTMPSQQIPQPTPA